MIKRLLGKNRDLILSEARFFNGLLNTLFKGRNTGTPWSKEDKAQLRLGLRRLSVYIPVLIIFLLPGGTLLLPFLAEALDRRKGPRGQGKQGGKVPPLKEKPAG